MMNHHVVRGDAIRRRRHTSALGAALGCGVLLLGVASASPAVASGPHSHRGVDYVALGDSYTSGPLIPRQVDANCARSDQNYPSLVATRRSTSTFTDVSCAYATTDHMEGAGHQRTPAERRRALHGSGDRADRRQ